MPQCHDRELSLSGTGTACRCFYNAVQRGRSERSGKAHSATYEYVEPLSDARAKLADCFNMLLGMCKIEGWGAAARTEAQMVPPSWDFLDCGDSRCP